MIDTHAHIYLPQFEDDGAEMLMRAESVGITDILMPAIDFESEKQMDSLISEHAGQTTIKLHRMAGIHPCDVTGTIDEKRLLDWCSKPEILAVGETGLDYYWSTEHVSDQKKSLKLHCKISKSLNKPIVLHNRDSTTDLLDIIESEQNGTLRGVWHCFTGTIEEGKRAIDLGLQLGIGGVVTFKNGGVDKTVKQLDLNQFILETDAPYLAPTPHRGKRNEPMYTQLVGIKLSEIFDLTLSEIDIITSSNARKLFTLEF
ncbi:MAG TPA: TatD family deoxyribonuclease [Bacteroidetes bacterium]|nr:TatD family deoxyribonuclease [Bacteroidota bacterium]